MTKTHKPVIALIGSVAALAVAISLGVLGGRLTTPPDITVAASDDAFALDFESPATSGSSPLLIAGAGAGLAAITYLKFRVTALPGGLAPRRAEVRLTRAAGSFPAHVELVRVPSNAWREATLSGIAAPRLGTVLGTARPDPLDGSIAFDVTPWVGATGTYSFAVTAPPGDGLAQFIAKEADRSLTRRLQPALWLSADGEIPRALGTDMPSGEPTPSWPTTPADPGPTEPTGPPADPTPTGPPTDPTPTDPAPTTEPMPTGPPTAPVPTDPPGGWPTGSPPAPTAPPSGWPEPPEPPEPPAPPAPPSIPPPSIPPPPIDPTLPPPPSASVAPPVSPSPVEPVDPGCEIVERLVPTCGVLWGVAPAAHTDTPRLRALREFETKTGRDQAVYHAYHRGTEALFPTTDEIAMAREPGRKRTLFLNWKPPFEVSWARIARGEPRVDAYLDRLAQHIRRTFPERFFLTVHHEPENEVRPDPGSGWTARDYAAMFRHVVERLRAGGATNMISVMAYMAYVPWNTKSWFEDLYPGNDVVDWVAWDSYAYSDPGYGHGDFAELMNRRSTSRPSWPGFYNWAAQRFPDKPLMLAEWGVWYSPQNSGHKAYFYNSVARQLPLFPRVKALVYFDTPANQKGYDSTVDSTPDALQSYRRLSQHPAFQVRLG